MKAGGSRQFGLPRERRMSERREFDQARLKGERIVKGCLIANWLPLEAGSAPRVGVITSRRIGSAVVRSRARRQLRESFRLHQNRLKQPVALVLVARPSIAGKDFSGVEKDFLTALSQRGLLTA